MATQTTSTNTTTRKLVRKAISAAPGSGLLELLPDSTRDGLEEKAVEFVENSPQVSRTLKDAHGFFDDLINSFQDFVLGIFDSKSLTTRNSMFAQIGVSSKGQPMGANPFTAIDAKLGIQVSEQLQALCESQIRDLAGWTGISSKAAAKTVLDMQGSIEEILFQGLRDKYGTKQNDKQLHDLAATTARAALGIDDDTLSNPDPAYWLAKSPPKTGIAGMIMGSAAANNGTAVALNFNSAALNALQSPKLADAGGKNDAKAKKEADAATTQAPKLAAADPKTSDPQAGPIPGKKPVDTKTPAPLAVS